MTYDEFTDSLASGVIGVSLSDTYNHHDENPFWHQTIGFSSAKKPLTGNRELCVEVRINSRDRNPTVTFPLDSLILVDELLPSIDIVAAYFSSEDEKNEYVAKMGVMSDIPMLDFEERFKLADDSWPDMDLEDFASLAKLHKSKSAKSNVADVSLVRVVPAFLRSLPLLLNFDASGNALQKPVIVNLKGREKIIDHISEMAQLRFSSDASKDFVSALVRVYTIAVIEGKVDERTRPTEMIPAIRDCLSDVTDEQRTKIQNFLNRLDDHFMGMGAPFEKTNKDNVVHHGFFIGIQSNSSNEVHSNIANQLKSPTPNVSKIAEFFLRLRKRSPASLMEAFHSGSQRYHSLSKCSTETLARGRIEFNVAMENAQHLEPDIAISAFGYRLRTSKLSLPPSLAEVATKVQRYTQFRVNRSVDIPDCLAVTVYCRDEKKSEVQVNVTASNHDADLFSISKCQVRKVFKTIKSYTKVLELSTKYRVSLGESIGKSSKEIFLEVGRRQPIGTLDDAELLGHLEAIAQSVIELNAL